jgi:Mrp family chromosome partitioning ATPase
MQSLPLDGVVVVTTPQDLVGMIVKKAIHMAEKLGVPVLGLIGNMSYIECPDCNKRIHLFGGNGLQAMAEETGIPLLASLPMMPDLAVLADEGKIELVDHLYPDFFMPVAKRLQDILEKE